MTPDSASEACDCEPGYWNPGCLAHPPSDSASEERAKITCLACGTEITLSEDPARYKREAEEAREEVERIVNGQYTGPVIYGSEAKKAAAAEAALSDAREALKKALTYVRSGEPSLAQTVLSRALSTPQRKETTT